MAALHSLLALYGALDESVVQADDPEWSALVERYLPGTTGEGQRGWYRQYRDLVSTLAQDPAAVEFPTPADAVSELNDLARRVGPSNSPDPRPGGPDDGDPADQPRASALTTGELAQVLYVVSALRRLAPHAPATGIDFSGFVDGAVPVDDIYGLAGDPPPWVVVSDRGAPVRTDRITELTSVLDDAAFTGIEAWPALMTQAAGTDILSVPLVIPDVALVAPFAVDGTVRGGSTDAGSATAVGAVTQIDGHFCAVLTTDSWCNAAGLSVDAVKNIVDPRNWAALSTFFVRMDPLPPDAQGASRVLEHVSTNKELFRLKTGLKYWKSNYADGAIINYELADDRSNIGDSQMIVVDNGFIHISRRLAPDGTDDGIRIRTSKMVAIQGASVTLTAMLINVIGYANLGQRMLFDGALKPIANYQTPLHPWNVSPEGPAGDAGAAATVPGAEADLPQIPANSGALLLAEAAKSWAASVEAASSATAAVVDKWYRGKLTASDMVAYSSEIGARLASEPWRFLASIGAQLPTDQQAADNTSGTQKGGPP